MKPVAVYNQSKVNRAFDVIWLKKFRPDFLDLGQLPVGHDAPRFSPGGPRPMPLLKVCEAPSHGTRIEFGFELLKAFFDLQRDLALRWREILGTRVLPGGLIYADNLALPRNGYRILRNGEEVFEGVLAQAPTTVADFEPLFREVLVYTEPG